MEIKNVIIAGIIIIVLAIIAGTLLGSSNDANSTDLKILNKDEIGENGTIYVKLTDNKNNSLSNKNVKIELIDKKGKTVLSKTVKTQVTGVGLVQINNITEGEYTINATFDGDGNLTQSNASKEVIIKSGYVEDDLNITVSEDGTVDVSTDASQTSYTSSNSYTPSQTPSQPEQSSDDQDSVDDQASDDDGNTYIDENGNEVEPEIDENGKEIEPT